MIDLELTTPDPFSGIKDFLERAERPGVGDRRRVADAIRQGFQRNFTQEGSASGQWRPLHPFTVRQRIAKGFPGEHPILVQTGRLRSSFITAGAADHVDNFETTPNGWRLIVGSKNDLAFKHEFGEGRVPARPISDLTDVSERGIVDAIDAMLEDLQAATVGR